MMVRVVTRLHGAWDTLLQETGAVCLFDGRLADTIDVALSSDCAIRVASTEDAVLSMAASFLVPAGVQHTFTMKSGSTLYAARSHALDPARPSAEVAITAVFETLTNDERVALVAALRKTWCLSCGAETPQPLCRCESYGDSDHD